MTAEFQDKIALITGGAKGLGLACAQAFAQAVARVAIVSRSEPEPRAAASKISSMTEVLWVVGDVANEAAAHEVFKRIEDRCNGLDYLVHNATVVVARSVLFLCNPVESRCTTGTTLEIFTNL